MSILSDLADACPQCFPGDHPASLPLAPPELDVNGSLRASYRCPEGHEWVCWWNPESAGWPAERRQAA